MRGLDCQAAARARVDPTGSPLSAREYERDQFTVFPDAYFEVGCHRLAAIGRLPDIVTIKNIWHGRSLNTV
jgi:hypothetical protein